MNIYLFYVYGVCLHVCLHHMCVGAHGEQMSMSGSLGLDFQMWLPGIKPASSGKAASAKHLSSLLTRIFLKRGKCGGLQRLLEESC